MEYNLKLNDYQRDNLMQLLRLVRTSRGPLSGANTGDWVAEIEYLLYRDNTQHGQPNVTDKEMLTRTSSFVPNPNDIMKGTL